MSFFIAACNFTATRNLSCPRSGLEFLPILSGQQERLRLASLASLWRRICIRSKTILWAPYSVPHSLHIHCTLLRLPRPKGDNAGTLGERRRGPPPQQRPIRQPISNAAISPAWRGPRLDWPLRAILGQGKQAGTSGQTWLCAHLRLHACLHVRSSEVCRALRITISNSKTNACSPQ